MRALASSLGVRLRLPRGTRAQGESRRPRCEWPWRGAYVSYGGDAMPCCMVSTPDRISFGNMVHDGVAAVWGNAAYESFRSGLASDNPAEICRGCAVYQGRS